MAQIVAQNAACRGEEIVEKHAIFQEPNKQYDFQCAQFFRLDAAKAVKFPPLDLVKSVKDGRIDSRIRREVLHYRYYFVCWDAEGKETDDSEKIARITLTRRGEALLI